MHACSRDQHSNLARSMHSCYCATNTENWRDQCALVMVWPSQKTGAIHSCYCVTNTENWRDQRAPVIVWPTQQTGGISGSRYVWPTQKTEEITKCLRYAQCNPHNTWWVFCNWETRLPLRAKFVSQCMHSDSCLSIKCCPVVTWDDNMSLSASGISLVYANLK